MVSMDCEVGTGEKIDRDPRMHMMADLSKEKFSTSVLYGLLCFSAKREASLL